MLWVGPQNGRLEALRRSYIRFRGGAVLQAEFDRGAERVALVGMTPGGAQCSRLGVFVKRHDRVVNGMPSYEKDGDPSVVMWYCDGWKVGHAKKQGSKSCGISCPDNSFAPETAGRSWRVLLPGGVGWCEAPDVRCIVGAALDEESKRPAAKRENRQRHDTAAGVSAGQQVQLQMQAPQPAVMIDPSLLASSMAVVNDLENVMLRRRDNQVVGRKVIAPGTDLAEGRQPMRDATGKVVLELEYASSNCHGYQFSARLVTADRSTVVAEFARDATTTRTLMSNGFNFAPCEVTISGRPYGTMSSNSSRLTLTRADGITGLRVGRAPSTRICCAPYETTVVATRRDVHRGHVASYTTDNDSCGCVPNTGQRRACQLLDAAAGDGLTRLDLLLIFTFVALEELISIHAASNTHVHEGEG